MNSSMVLMIVAGLAGFAVGLLVMWLILRIGSRHNRQHNQVLLHQFTQYRNEVDRHFMETATAVDELNRSYQKVIDHLSRDAQQLMNPDVLREQLSKRADKSVTVAYLTQQDAAPERSDDLPPPPPYTDATAAEVVPVNGQPDRVPDRIGKQAATTRTRQ